MVSERLPRRLQPYAAAAARSRGRRFQEPEHPYRDCFERDRDRIIHSRAFRRLEYKTQVFPNYHGDHFRTRLTHTIEVAQLARTAARALGLNTTLAEAIALAHDLGHPPFGHVGERVLDEMSSASGGFEHNRHSLRTVDEIEERYAGFPGLNLTFEVREGLAKHSTRYDRFSEEELAEFDPAERSSLEAQLIDHVDEIAYNLHDVDDGVEARILTPAEVAEAVPLFGRAYTRVGSLHPDAPERARFNETVRALIDELMTDLIEASRLAVLESGVDDVDAVRAWPEDLIAPSKRLQRELDALGEFLFERLYRGPLVAEQMAEAKRVLAELVEAYRADPTLLPPRHRSRAERLGIPTAIVDYVAGMTDRYVMREHARILGEGVEPPARA